MVLAYLLIACMCICDNLCATSVNQNISEGCLFSKNCALDMNHVDNATITSEPRKSKDDLMSRILPMMVMPFMTSTILLPMMLVSMKIMMLNSMLLGKLAIIFGAFTFLKNMSRTGGGLFSHNINVIPHGGGAHRQEYGAYGHKRRKKRRTTIEK